MRPKGAIRTTVALGIGTEENRFWSKPKARHR